MAWKPDYIDDDDFKAYLKINDTTDDAFLPSDITSGSRTVDFICSQRRNGLGFPRQFGLLAAPEAKYYTPRWDCDLAMWVIEVDDFMTTVGLVVSFDLDQDFVYETTVDSTSVIPRPQQAVSEGFPYTQIAITNTSSAQPTGFTDSAKVVCRYGWTDIPETVKRATRIQAHRYKKRREAPFGVSGSPQRQTESSILDEIDPDVELMLQPYVRLGWTL